MEKSPQAFRTISEVSKVLDVPAHVLRFWESRFTQVRPVKRGGGRRYYRPEDIDLIRGIRDLLYVEGLTIKGAQKVLREKGAKHVIALGQGEEAVESVEMELWEEPELKDVAQEVPDAPIELPETVAPQTETVAQSVQSPPETVSETAMGDLFAEPSEGSVEAAPPDETMSDEDQEALRRLFGKLVALRQSMSTQS